MSISVVVSELSKHSIRELCREKFFLKKRKAFYCGAGGVFGFFFWVLFSFFFIKKKPNLLRLTVIPTGYVIFTVHY